MPFICIGPVCIPWAAVWPLFLILWRPLWALLKPLLMKIPFCKKLFEEAPSEPAVKDAVLVKMSVDEVAKLQGGIHKLASRKDWEELMQKAASTNMPVMVKWTAEWCGPCKRIEPKYQELYKAHKKCVVFAEASFDGMGRTRKQCRVKAIPTFQLYRNLIKVAQVQGAMESALVETVTKASEDQKLILQAQSLKNSKMCYTLENEGEWKVKGEEAKELTPQITQGEKRSAKAVILSLTVSIPGPSVPLLLFAANPSGQVIAVARDSKGVDFRGIAGAYMAYAWYGEEKGLWGAQGPPADIETKKTQ
ncbi:hypothetical protein AAMO2058_001312900 [Amorphochlora amoebiformis]